MTFTSRAMPLIAAGLLAASAATQAAPISYSGALVTGSVTGAVQAESGPFGGAANWSFWTFTTPFLYEATITVTPISELFDPIFAIWYGTESDTDAYFDMTSSSLNTLFVGGADGIGDFGPAGIGDPASLTFTNIYGTGPFVLAIADYVDGAGNGLLDFSITASVPEPQTPAQMLLGLAAVGWLLRKRQQQRG